MIEDKSPIIHPRNQGTGGQSEFYEPWRHRSRPIEINTCRPKHMTSRLADDNFRSRLKSMTRLAFSEDDIARSLGISKRSVRRYRKMLGIRPRRLEPDAQNPNVDLAVTMPVKLYSRIKRASGHDGMSNFIRTACLKELDRLDLMGR